MSKLGTMLIVGLAVSGLALSTPSESQAQSAFSIQYNSGGGYFGRPTSSFGIGYSSGPSYFGPGYNPGFNQPYCNSGFNNYYGGSPYGYGQRSVIVQPQNLHWTPNRGLHTHGTVAVPHRNHYHVYPY